MRDGVRLQFYFPEGTRHGHVLLHEWLLSQARACGIKGASVFRAIAGYGRHGRMHYGHFFESAGELPLEVRVMTTEDLAQRLLDVLERDKVHVFFVRSAAQYGWTGGGPDPD
jgi:PII-like signaling protein